MNAENIVQRTSVEIAPIPSESFKNLPKLSTKEFRATVETGAGTATFDVQCTKKEYLKSGRIETSFLADISAEDGNIMLSGQMVSGTTDNTTERFTVNEEFQVANSGHDGKLCLATTGTFFHMVPRSLTPNLLADDIRNTLKEVVTSGMESREVMSETEMFSKKNVIFRAMEDISESFGKDVGTVLGKTNEEIQELAVKYLEKHSYNPGEKNKTAFLNTLYDLKSKLLENIQVRIDIPPFLGNINIEAATADQFSKIESSFIASFNGSLSSDIENGLFDDLISDVKKAYLKTKEIPTYKMVDDIFLGIGASEDDLAEPETPFVLDVGDHPYFYENFRECEADYEKFFQFVIIRILKESSMDQGVVKKVDFTEAGSEIVSSGLRMDNEEPFDGDGVDEIIDDKIMPAIDIIFAQGIGGDEKAEALVGDTVLSIIKGMRNEWGYSNGNTEMNPIILIEQIRNTINLHEGNLTNKEYEELEDALLQEYSPKTSFAVGDKIKFYNVYVEGDRLNLNPLPAFNGADVIQNEQIAFQMKRRVELGQGFDKKDEKEISIGYETETITEVDEDGNITNSESEEYFENVKEDDITT